MVTKRLTQIGVLALMIMGVVVLMTRYSSINAQSSNATQAAAQNPLSIEEFKAVVMHAGWGTNISIEFDEDNNMVIKGDGLPNHEIMEMYPALNIFDMKTFYMIKPQPEHIKLVIPLQPKMAAEKTAAPSGLIGIAISGGLIYGPYEADGKRAAMDDKSTVVNGLPFLDACNGHPNPLAVQYHYHGVPYCITDTLDKKDEHSHLLGYLLDGYPIYGPQGDNGVEITPADLDECNGVFSATPEFPEGIYHYIITEESPYTPPCLSGEVDLQPVEIRGIDFSYPVPLPPPGALIPLPSALSATETK